MYVNEHENKNVDIKFSAHNEFPGITFIRWRSKPKYWKVK